MHALHALRALHEGKDDRPDAGRSWRGQIPQRPHTSNDNPFSEAHFKTMEYQPEFPEQFETIGEARAFCRRFFDWYNQDHHHAGILAS